MQFRTPVHIVGRHNGLITHDKPVMFVGSCFAGNIGGRLRDDGFDARINPTGVLYNPASIANMFARAVSGAEYSHRDLICHDGIWHSMDHHSSFSAADPANVIRGINEALTATRNAICSAAAIFVTLGTAYVYRLATTGAIVANCHKLHPSAFVRQRLSADEAAEALAGMVRDIRSLNPTASIFLTVSPIRHLADGLHDNQLSKATLLLAADEICRRCDAGYFPAYEIMMDDLRDYRFYASDMTHPSDMAVDYIYEQFAATFFTSQTINEASVRRKAIKRSLHRQIIKQP